MSGRCPSRKSIVAIVEPWELVSRGLRGSLGQTRGCITLPHTHTHTLQTRDRNTKAMAFSHLTCLTTTIPDTLFGVCSSLIYSGLALIVSMTMFYDQSATIAATIKLALTERMMI